MSVIYIFVASASAAAATACRSVTAFLVAAATRSARSAAAASPPISAGSATESTRRARGALCSGNHVARTRTWHASCMDLGTPRRAKRSACAAASPGCGLWDDKPSGSAATVAAARSPLAMNANSQLITEHTWSAYSRRMARAAAVSFPGLGGGGSGGSGSGAGGSRGCGRANTPGGKRFVGTASCTAHGKAVTASAAIGSLPSASRVRVRGRARSLAPASNTSGVPSVIARRHATPGEGTPA